MVGIESLDVVVLDIDGTDPHWITQQPLSTIWTTPVIDETFGGTPITSGESTASWQFGATKLDGMTETEYAQIIAKREPDGRIRIRTPNDETPGRLVECIGYIDGQPSRTIVDGMVLGLVINFRRLVAV